MTDRPRLLLIDDDHKLGTLLTEYLGGQGLHVQQAFTGQQGLALAHARAFDLVLLDVMLPEIDGIEVCRRLRQDGSRVPILMLTARGEEADRVMGLELGADDYLPKPFSPRELLARIRALLRRAKEPGPHPDQPVQRGPLILNPGTRSVELNGEPVRLTTYEFELLRLLMLDAGRVLSRDQILDRLKGEEFDAFDRSIDVHISKLRQKLEMNPKDPQLIKTVRGVGYQLVT